MGVSLSTGKIPYALNWGLEKEQLRLTPDGILSQRSHPSSLAPPFFTRDFAEAQLEMVTGVETSIPAVLSSMESLTDEAREAIGSEILWPLSMPPFTGEQEIRIADFTGNPQPGIGIDEARIKTLYREGLALRYGKARQLICGVHINLSIPSDFLSLLYRRDNAGMGDPNIFNSQLYTGLVGYLYRQMPLILQFSAASPFGIIPGNTGYESEELKSSVRNSPFGYAGRTYRSFLDLSSYSRYLDGIRRGRETESCVFHFMGLLKHSRPVQLNSRIFQTDSEFYAPVRIRQQRKGSSLDLRLEVRTADLNPFTKSGVSPELLYLLNLLVAEWFAGWEFEKWKDNPALYMRENQNSLPGVFDRFDEVSMAHPLNPGVMADQLRARNRLLALTPVAAELDAVSGGREFSLNLEKLQYQAAHPSVLPASRLVDEFERCGRDWSAYTAKKISEIKQHTEDAHELSPGRV